MQFRYLLIPAIFLVGFASSSLARPWTEKGVLGPLHLKPGVIIVYIPKDPLGLGREQAVADGLKPWNDDQTVKDLGIKLEARIGEDRPEGEENGIQVEWTNDKPEGTPGYFKAEAGDDGSLSGAKIQLWKDASQSKELILKTMIHETGHGLGQDHPKNKDTVSVMQPENKLTSLSDYDKKEIGHAYSQYLPGKVELKSDVIPDLGLWKYRYELEWFEGPELAFIQFDVNGASISNVSMPPGWAVDMFESPNDVAVELLGPARSNFGFSVADAFSYLGPDFPKMTFEFVANLPPGQGYAFTAGRIGAVVPVPVPAPATWSMMVVGFGLAGVGLRRQQSRAKELLA